MVQFWDLYSFSVFFSNRTKTSDFPGVVIVERGLLVPAITYWFQDFSSRTAFEQRSLRRVTNLQRRNFEDSVLIGVDTVCCHGYFG